MSRFGNSNSTHRFGPSQSIHQINIIAHANMVEMDPNNGVPIVRHGGHHHHHQHHHQEPAPLSIELPTVDEEEESVSLENQEPPAPRNSPRVSFEATYPNNEAVCEKDDPPCTHPRREFPKLKSLMKPSGASVPRWKRVP